MYIYVYLHAHVHVCIWHAHARPLESGRVSCMRTAFTVYSMRTSAEKTGYEATCARCVLSAILFHTCKPIEGHTPHLVSQSQRYDSDNAACLAPMSNKNPEDQTLSIQPIKVSRLN